METQVFNTAQELGRSAAEVGAASIRKAISDKGAATIILATGTSQFETLASLTAAPDIDWSLVTVFHLDEYIGIPETHQASFRKFLQSRFIDLVTPGRFVPIDGEASDPEQQCQILGEFISSHTVNVAFIGIGENGHLAFNDPPADFKIDRAYHVVELDLVCRRQQLREGWFGSLKDVPTHAISMTIQEIMRAEQLVVSVPDERKSDAVAAAIQGEVTPDVPASILQRHADATLFLDSAAASKISHV